MAQDRPQRIEAKEVALTSAGSWTGTILYFLFSAGFFLYALFGWREVVPILISGFFAAWGVAAIVMMVRTGSSQGRYGPMPLDLEGPAAVGGRLRASLTVPGTATNAMPLTLRAVLICSTVTYTDKGGRREEPVRGLQKDVAVSRGSASTRVNFDIEIPVDLPPTDDPGAAAAVRGRGYASWELKVRALGDDANLARSYDIRVGGKQMAAAPVVPTVAAAVLSQDGPFEILRPGTRVEAPPVKAPTVPPPAVVTSAAAEEPPAPGMLLPDDDHRSLWVLVALNLIPLAGVLWAGWRVHEVVFLYWIENLVIGAVNVLRMRIAVPDTVEKLARRGVEPSAGELFAAKAALIGFFIVHYGAFCMGHGVFLASFFPAGPDGSRELAGVLRAMLLDKAALIAITGIVVSHAYSYFHNYIGRGEYLRANMQQMMFRPYKRIVVTHLFIFAGAFALQFLGSPVAAILAFIGLKISIDGYAHLQERKLLSPQAGVTSRP